MNSSKVLFNTSFIFSLFISLFLLFASTMPLMAQDEGNTSQNKLVNPELFEKILPEELPPNWEKSGFSARTSDYENWGGATYMGEGGSYMQVGLRHFTSSAWDQNKAEAKDEDESIEVGNYSGYLGKTMGQQELKIFFGNNFSARAAGPDLTGKELSSILEQLPFEKVNALAKDVVGNQKEKVKQSKVGSLKTILPDTLAGMIHGRIQTAPEQPILAVTYGAESIPYSVNIQLASGDPMQKAKSDIKEELNETNTDLQEISHNGSKLLFRNEESAVSYIAFRDEILVMISADAPVNTSFDKKEARDRLLQGLDELKANM